MVFTFFVAGKDAFAVLSIGYGKSLFYACLPLLSDNLHQLQESQASIVVVVTSLIDIMED